MHSHRAAVATKKCAMADESGGEQPAPQFKAPAPRAKPLAPPPRFAADTPVETSSPVAQQQAGNDIDGPESNGSADASDVAQPKAQAPPEFAAPSSRAAGTAAAKAAAVAAARAAQHATPAQRERMVMEAAAGAIAANQAQQEREAEAAAKRVAASEAAGGEGAASAAPRPASGAYEPPKWAGIPTGCETLGKLHRCAHASQLLATVPCRCIVTKPLLWGLQSCISHHCSLPACIA